MRTLRILVISVAALGPLIGCGSDPERPPAAAEPSAPSPGASPATSGPAATGPSPSRSTAKPGTGAPWPPGTGQAAPAPSRSVTTRPVPPPTAGELPGGLPFGDRKLTGVVERSGDCTVLRVGTRRWGLIGGSAGTLVVGRRITVEGQVTTPDAGCSVPDVAQAVLVRRVTPA
jgi:hypothetical protein